MVADNGTGKPASLLIVEDEPLLAGLIGETVREIGFCVVGTASSGTEALSLIGAERPTLALVDIRLSGPVDGIELACRLREEFAIPTIFLSGAIDPETAVRARAAQPLALVEKPFRPSEVFNAIERALSLTQGC